MNFISKSKKYNLLIYGCGSIGFRHLEAAIKTNLNLNIFIYDRNFKSYKTISKLINLLIYYLLKVENCIC